MDIHRYRSILSWRGSTRVGYERYDRTHRVTVPPAHEPLTLASSPAFRGDPRLASPEQLLLAAASSCQLLSFLARAAPARIDVLRYDDDAEALMPEDTNPMRITRITLRPRAVVAAGMDVDRVIHLMHRAHDGCFVANTLTAEMVIEPAVEFADAVEAAA
jgi:organic hydroperoxide reductase OsmC/OhrA